MKTKLPRLFAFFFAAILAAVALAACGPKDVKKPANAIIITVSGGQAQTVNLKEYIENNLVTDKNYTMPSKKESLGQILDELADKHGLHLLANNSDYGRWFDEIGSLIPASGSNEFIALYSDCNDITYSFFEMKAAVDGVTYYLANYGFDSMPALDGVSYCIFLDVF